MLENKVGCKLLDSCLSDVSWMGHETYLHDHMAPSATRYPKQ